MRITPPPQDGTEGFSAKKAYLLTGAFPSENTVRPQPGQI